MPGDVSLKSELTEVRKAIADLSKKLQTAIADTTEEKNKILGKIKDELDKQLGFLRDIEDKMPIPDAPDPDDVSSSRRIP